MPNNGGLVSAPIGLEDIRQALVGESTLDLGSLCTSSLVNKWSRKKPIAVNQPQELTDAQWKENNYGYVIPTYNTRPAVWQAYVNGTGWDYIKPTAYFRATDFEGYYHYAKSPFEGVELYNSTPAIGTNVVFDMSGLEDIFTWGYFSGYSATNLQFGVLCSNGGYFPITGGAITFDNIEWGKVFCSITSEHFTVGNSYTFCPVITTYSNVTPQTWMHLGPSETTGTWWLLPVNELKATITANKTVMDYISVSQSTNSMTATDQGLYFQFSGISTNITISLDSGYSSTSAVSISATLYHDYNFITSPSESPVIEIGSISGISITRGNSSTKTLTSSAVIKSSSMKELDSLNCRLHVVAVVNSTTYEGDFALVLDTTSWN